MSAESLRAIIVWFYETIYLGEQGRYFLWFNGMGTC